MLSDKREGEAHAKYDKNREGHLKEAQPPYEHSGRPQWFDIILIVIFIAGIVYRCSTGL